MNTRNDTLQNLRASLQEHPLRSSLLTLLPALLLAVVTHLIVTAAGGAFLSKDWLSTVPSLSLLTLMFTAFAMTWLMNGDLTLLIVLNLLCYPALMTQLQHPTPFTALAVGVGTLVYLAGMGAVVYASALRSKINASKERVAQMQAEREALERQNAEDDPDDTHNPVSFPTPAPQTPRDLSKMN